MAIGWSEIGDLQEFSSKDEMKSAMKETYDENLTYRNTAHATWQFANEMHIGDIVFVKRGRSTIIGRGVVASDYEFDEDRKDEYKNVRAVSHEVAGMLLYAKTDEAVIPDNYVYQMNGNQITVTNLDLNCEFVDIRKQLDDIVKVFFNKKKI